MRGGAWLGILAGVAALTAVSAHSADVRDPASPVQIVEGPDFREMAVLGFLRGEVSDDAVVLDLVGAPGTVTTFGSILTLENSGASVQVARLVSSVPDSDGLQWLVQVDGIEWNPVEGPSPPVILQPHARSDVSITMDWRSEGKASPLRFGLA